MKNQDTSAKAAELKIRTAASYFNVRITKAVLHCNTCKIPVDRDVNAAGNLVTKALMLLRGEGLPGYFKRAAEK